MPEFVIPCEVFARLTAVLKTQSKNANEWFNTVRIDNGIAICSNRLALVAERIEPQAGVIHIVADPVLIEQCRTEAPFGSKLHISVNEAMFFAAAKTTLGYVHQGNAALWSGGENDLDRWREILPSKPVKKAQGGMFWTGSIIHSIAESSPSGRIVFEELTSNEQPMYVRDIYDDNWCAVVNAYSSETKYAPASRPEWLK